MRYNALDEKWIPAQWEDELGTHICLFNGNRIDRSTVPYGYTMYEVRHDDDGVGDWAEIKSSILVNFLGTILVEDELDANKYNDKYIIVNDYSYLG